MTAILWTAIHWASMAIVLNGLGTIPVFVWSDWGKSWKPNRMACVQA